MLLVQENDQGELIFILQHEIIFFLFNIVYILKLFVFV